MFQYFEKLIDPYAPYEEVDHPPQKLWPFLFDYLRPFKKVFWFAGIMSVIVAIIEVWLIGYMGRIVDLLGQSDPQTFWQDYRIELIGVAAFILLARPVFQALDVLILNNTLIPNVGTLVRWRAHKHVLRQSVGWFENDFAGRIANRIMQTPPATGEVVFQTFDALTFSIAYFIGAIFLMNDADPRLIIPLVIWIVLYGALVRWTLVRIGPASKASSDARSAVTGRVVDSYSNIHSVKMFAHHDKELEFGKEAIEEARRTLQAEMRIFTIMDVMLVLLNGFLVLTVIGWAIVLWVNGTATIGVVAVASAMTLRLNAMTGWIMWALTSFFQNLGIISEGMETIAQPITLLDKEDAQDLEITNGEIKLQALSHHYGRDSGGLSEISLMIKANEKIGVVGRSGAGKSTLVKLLLRFYDPDGGSILIDGMDISTISQDSLRANIGMVQQDSSLLHRSIRDNILYGAPNASEDQMIKAAVKAEATEFIADLEDQEGRQGYDAHVGERGVKLSGGQRQRIALARVILKDAPILLLDEATSALDSEVEAAIQKTLYGMMEGKTVVAIAHRLSTIAQMDRIVVIDGGKIVEDGNHQALLAQDGLYAAFWQRQSGGFLNTEAEE